MVRLPEHLRTADLPIYRLLAPLHSTQYSTCTGNIALAASCWPQSGPSGWPDNDRQKPIRSPDSSSSFVPIFVISCHVVFVTMIHTTMSTVQELKNIFERHSPILRNLSTSSAKAFPRKITCKIKVSTVPIIYFYIRKWFLTTLSVILHGK